MKKKNNYHHGNLKEDLVKEAINIIKEDGVENLKLNTLAKRLDITPPALYRHFSSKDELIDTITLYAFDIFDEEIIAIEKDEKYNCLEKLYLFGKSYINFAIKNPNLFKIMFGKRFYRLRDIKNRDEAIALYIILDKLVEGQNKNIFKKDDPLVQVSVIHSTVHGIATLYINDYVYIKENFDAVYNTSFEISISGLMINPDNLKEDIKNIIN